MNKNINNVVFKAGLLVLSCSLSACDTKKQPVTQESTKKADTNTQALQTEKAPSNISPNKEANMLITLDSGLQYKTIRPGTSDQKPAAGQKVEVHYTGWLWNNGIRGTKFDSSVDRGQKFTFTIGVGQVIKGWDQGVMDMKVGEKRELIIPAHLAYGSRGAGGLIPGGATLMFEVELFKVG